jgi:hypothetical protein
MAAAWRATHSSKNDPLRWCGRPRNDKPLRRVTGLPHEVGPPSRDPPSAPKRPAPSARSASREPRHNGGVSRVDRGSRRDDPDETIPRGPERCRKCGCQRSDGDWVIGPPTRHHVIDLPENSVMREGPPRPSRPRCNRQLKPRHTTSWPGGPASWATTHDQFMDALDRWRAQPHRRPLQALRSDPRPLARAMELHRPERVLASNRGSYSRSKHSHPAHSYEP